MAGEAKRLELRATLSGPFFEKDPKATFRRNLRAMMDALAAEGEQDVRSQIPSAQVRGQVRGYTTSPKTGKRWAVSAAINHVPAGLSKAEAIQSAAKLYGRRKGNRGTTVGIEKRLHPFSRTARAIRSARAVMAADLTKGMT